MPHDVKPIMITGRVRTDVEVTRLLDGAGQRYKARLLSLRKRIDHERELTDFLISNLERRVAHAEDLAAIRQQTIDSRKLVTELRGVEDFDEPQGSTH